MAARKLTDQDIEVVLHLAKDWGRRLVDQAFGPDQPGLDTKFCTIEDFAWNAARSLNAGVIEEMLRRHAAGLPGPQPCPACGQLCKPATESRTIEARGGPAETTEPVCHCPTCRRDFFPSASPVGAR
jgi:hypothetical protein